MSRCVNVVQTCVAPEAGAGRLRRTYLDMACGGTIATVFQHVFASIRNGTGLPLTTVLPLATLAGTRLAWPGAVVSSAAREQLPSGIVHQLDVIG